MSSSHQSRRRRQQASFRRHQLRLEGLEKRYALNAAPVLDDSASPTLGSILEDTGAPVGPAGTLVSDLIDAGGPLNNFSDVDGDQPGIAITDTNLQGGALWYSRDDGVSWFDVGVLSNAQPLLMPAVTGSRLYYEPAADFNGTISDVFTISAWDQHTVLEQIGEDLIGEADDDYFGRGVAVSADGGTVVVGGFRNDAQGTDAGNARVFRWTGTAWEQLGTDIDGLYEQGFMGFRVAISDNGNRIAISGHESDAGGSYSGLVQVYEWDGATWNQLGQDLVGAPGDLFGHSLANSGDISVLAVGAYHGGYVEIYRWNGLAWEQLGSRLATDGDGIGIAGTLSISHDGTVVSTGRSWADANGVNSGTVRVFEWSGDDWIQRGAEIPGADAGEEFCRTALSADGNVLAVGAAKGAGEVVDSGRVAVYRWSGQAWYQIGSDLKGTAAGDNFGWTVAVSNDGGTVIAGAQTAVGVGARSGEASVFRWMGTDWRKVGDTILGTAVNQRLGISVDISLNGNTVIAGGISSSSSHPGLARVYAINASDSSTSTLADAVSIEVQAQNDAPVLQGDQAVSLAQVQEDSGAPVGAVGSLVSELIDASGPRNNFSDIDGDLPGIAIVEQDLQGGTLWHSLDNGVTWKAVGTASEGEPFLLFSDSATRLYYQPAADFSGTLASVVKFRAWDGNASWEKVGLDLVGSGEGDLFGRSVAISADGLTVAVGGYRNDQNGADAGEVRVYTWSGGAWTQLGEDIVGDAAGDTLGFTLDLSADGRRLVVGMSGSDLGGDDAGAVRVFEWSGTAWVQLGSNIVGTNPGDEFGHSLSMSKDGSTIALGSTVADYVDVFQWNGSVWQQQGQRFTGTYLGSVSTLSLSKDGTVIALGAAGPDDTPANSGVVRVFQWFNNEWVQLGNEIQGDLEGGFFSRTSLSADGMTLAVGAYSAARGVYYGAGYVRVFRVGSSGWQQIGADLVGNNWSDKFGWSVSLSDDGNRVVIGSDESNGNSAGWGGEVQAFRWDGAGWLTEGQIINGAANNSRIGISVDSSANGNIFVAGSYQEDVSGRASVFRRVAAPGSTSSEIGELSVDVLPVNDAPVLDTNSSPTLEPIAEDASVPVGQVGTLVSSLIDTDGPLNNFSDIDGDLPGIAITGTNQQGGMLWYSTDDGATWLDVGAVSETEPQLLAADANTRLYFQPAADFSGTISDVISFRAWDGNFEWIHYGETVEGDLAGGRFGYKVALSEDGQRLVVTAIENSRNGTWSGEVKFFDWNPAAMNWQSSGSTLAGESAGDFFGISLGFASNTDFISIGSMYSTSAAVNSGEVRIFERDAVTGEYVQRGDALTGIEAGERFGHASDISEDGKTVVVGADKSGLGGEDSGRVSVFRWNDVEGIWDTLGQEFIGNAGDRAGSVTISADGKIVAYGSAMSQEVRVFEWAIDSQAWIEKGPKLSGSGITAESFGTNVCLSDDGQRLAVTGLIAGESGEGAVTVYEWSQSEGRWLILGEVIVGEAAGDYFGRSLSFAENGNTVVVGARRNDGGGNGSGHARVFNWEATAGVWSQVGQDLDGALPGDDAGISVSMIPNGTLVAVGADYSDPNGNQSGSVQVYKKVAVLSESGNTAGVTVDPQNDPPTGDVTVDGVAEEDRVLTATNDLADIDGLGVIAYEWSRDGAAISGATASTYTLTQDDVGSSITATARYTDNDSTLETVTSSATSPVLNLNDAPTGDVTIDGSATQNAVLSANTSTVQDEDGLGAFTYQWLRDGLPIASATSSTYTLTQDDVDTQISVQVDYTDNEGTAETLTSAQTSAVVNVNDAPVLDPSASLHLPSVLEDSAAPSGQIGSLVSDLIDAGGTHNNFSDVDGDSPGIAITGTNLQGGTLWYSTDDGATWLDVGAVSDEAPRLLATDTTTRVYFEPNADFSGSISDVISFKAWDRKLIWQQLGHDIDGEAAGDLFGRSVSLSADGQTVAIGAHFNDGTGLNSGHTRIYHRTGSTWTQLGADIDGEAANDNSGRSVSLSSDGQTVAIGAFLNDGNGSSSGHTRIYRWTGTAWTQLGADIDGEAAEDQSGFSVSLSADGQNVAIGAHFNDGNGLDSGHTRIYRWTGTAWAQLGADIYGEVAGDNSGRSVSLSFDGQTVAVGAYFNDGNGSNSGHTRIYNWTGSTWTQLGADIDGEAAGDHSSRSVSLSSDGQTLAVGAFFNDGNGMSAGHTRIYRWTGSAWTQLGADIDGEAAVDQSSRSLSLSSDGQTVAVGAFFNDGNGTNSGHARVYHWTGSAWTQLGADIDGEAAGDLSGFSVSLSSDGQTVAIGAYNNDGNGTNSGHVRIFQFVPSVSTVTDTISITVNAVNEPPTLDAITSVTVLEDSPQQSVSLTGITAGGSETQPLRVTATSNNTDLIPNPTVTYASTDTTGSLAFTPVVDANGTATITVTVEDGGNDNILATVSDNLSFSQTFDVVVEPVNDRPVLNPTASPQLSPIAVGSGSPVGAVGTLVSALIDAEGPLTNYSDVDGDPPGIAITGVNLLDGKLWFSTDGGVTWGDVGAVSESNVRVLAADALTRVYYEPLISSGTTISDVLQYKAWDGTNGAMNGDLVGDGIGSLLERPKQIGVFGSYVEDYVISSNNARGYLIGPTGFSIYDISNPILPVLVGQEATFLSYSAGSRVWLSSDESFAFCASSINVNVYDIRDSTQPTLVSTYVMASATYYATYSARSDRLYVPSLEWNEQSNQDLVVRVIDTSNPYQLEDLGELRFGNIGATRSLNSSFLSPDDTLLYISQRVTNNGVATGYVDVVDVSGDELVSVRLAGSVLPEPEYGNRFGNHAVNADGSLIAIAGETVVSVLEVGDAGAIELVDQIQLPSTAFGLAFSGNTNELVVCYDNHVNFYTAATAGGYALTGSVAGGRYKPQTRTSGSNVFALTGSSSSAGALGAVGIFDVSSGYSPLVVGTEGVGSRLRDVALSADGSVLFAANGWGEWGALDIYAVANPGTPSLLASLSTPGGADSVAVSSAGDHLYVADGVSGLRIYDVSNPASPVVVNVVVLGGDVTGVVLDENRSLAYVTDESAGVHVVDISNAQNSQRVVTFNPEYNGSGKGARDVAISEDGSLLYVSSFSGLSVHQISGIADVQQLWFGAGPGYFGEVLRAGDVLFVCQDRDKGLHAYDLSAPMEPLLIGRYFDSVLDVGVSHDSNELYVVTQGKISYGADFHGVIVCDLDAFLDVAEKGAFASSRLYDVTSTSVVIDTVVGGPESVALSADGEHLFVGSWGHLSYPAIHVVDLNQQVEEATAYSLQSDSVSVIVTAVNKPPVLELVGDAVVAEDSPEQSVSITGITAGGSETQPLRVTASSSNPGLIPNPSVTYTSADSTGSLAFTPVADQHGTATITVTVEDGGLDNDLATVGDNATFSQTFDVDVTSVNDAPTLDLISDRVLPEDSQTQIVDITGITAGGGETQPLQVTVTSSNPSLISDPTITSDAVSVEGSRSLAFAPLPDQYGIATITVTVEDGGLDLDLSTAEDNAIFSRTFDVTVTPDTDDPPSPVTPHGRMFIHEILSGDPQVSYQLPAVNVNGEAINGLPTRITVTSSDTALIPDPTVLYASADVPSSLSFIPVANANGTATLSIRVEDGGPDNDFSTTADNRQATHQVEVTVLQIISNQGSAILAKDSSDSLYVNTQPVIYKQQQVPQAFFGSSVVSADTSDSENALLLQPLGAYAEEPTHRLLTDETWRINGIFNSLQNASSLVLDLSGREVSGTLNIVAVAGAYEINGVNNPTLVMRRGQTYTFNLNTAGHPFWLQTTGGGYQSANVYSNGFTGNSQTTGEHQWVVPVDAPDEIFYQCEFHPVMFGKIIVVD